MARFEELEVWKKSARLSADLYKAMANSKDFGFRDQITRASLPIPSAEQAQLRILKIIETEPEISQRQQLKCRGA